MAKKKKVGIRHFAKNANGKNPDRIKRVIHFSRKDWQAFKRKAEAEGRTPNDKIKDLMRYYVEYGNIE